MSFQQWVYVHLQLLSAFAILKPWRSTWQNHILCVCLALLLAFYQVSALLNSHTIKKIFLFLLLKIILSFRHEKHLQIRATYFYNAKLFHQERESWAHHYMLLSWGIFTLSALCFSTKVVNTMLFMTVL